MITGRLETRTVWERIPTLDPKGSQVQGSAPPLA
jgi:hypothetical protein